MGCIVLVSVLLCHLLSKCRGWSQQGPPRGAHHFSLKPLVWIALVKNSSSTFPHWGPTPAAPSPRHRSRHLMANTVTGWAWWKVAGLMVLNGPRWIKNRGWTDGTGELGWSRGKVGFGYIHSSPFCLHACGTAARFTWPIWLNCISSLLWS